jgi:hypothetical protein
MDRSAFIRGLLDQPEPRKARTYAPFGVLPLSEDDAGVHFDPSAGLLGSVLRGATLPGDVTAGKVDPMSEEGFARTQDLAGLMAGGVVPFESPAGALRAGPSRPAAPAVPQHLLDAAAASQERTKGLLGRSAYGPEQDLVFNGKAPKDFTPEDWARLVGSMALIISGQPRMLNLKRASSRIK